MTESIMVVAMVLIVFGLFSIMAQKAENIVRNQAEEQRLAAEAVVKGKKR